MALSDNKMTDKERILTYLVAWLGRPDFRRKPEELEADKFSGVWIDYREESLKPGALVLCMTSGMRMAHPFVVAWVVERISSHECLLREIGTDKLCSMSNEKFYVIRGLDHTRLLEGSQHRFYIKVLKAIGKIHHYWHRFGDIRFEGDEAVVTIREAFGGLLKDDTLESVPYEIRMPWHKKTAIKVIAEALKAGGYGERKFERRSKEPELPNG